MPIDDNELLRQAEKTLAESQSPNTKPSMAAAKARQSIAASLLVIARNSVEKTEPEIIESAEVVIDPSLHSQAA